jgi:hypothetical protein
VGSWHLGAPRGTGSNRVSRKRDQGGRPVPWCALRHRVGVRQAIGWIGWRREIRRLARGQSTGGRGRDPAQTGGEAPPSCLSQPTHFRTLVGPSCMLPHLVMATEARRFAIVPTPQIGPVTLRAVLRRCVEAAGVKHAGNADVVSRRPLVRSRRIGRARPRRYAERENQYDQRAA